MEAMQNGILKDILKDQHESIVDSCKDVLEIITPFVAVDDLMHSHKKTSAQEKEIQKKIKRMEGFQEKISLLREEIKELKKQIVETSPDKEVNEAKIIFSFVHEIRQAVCLASNEEDGFSFYQVPFLEKFVLPALEGRLVSEWVDDDMWATIDELILQRIQPFHYKYDEAFADLKKKLSMDKIQSLVHGICAKEQCGAEDIRSFIERLHKIMKKIGRS